FVAYAICANVPAVQSLIYSSSTQPDDRFSIWAAVPETMIMLGAGVDGGTYGTDKGVDVWMRDGWVVNLQGWQPAVIGYDSYTSPVRAYIAQGIDGRSKSANAQQPPGRAVAAVFGVPNDNPYGPYGWDVIEYYNARLDHYFMTALTSEMLSLDR